MIEVLSAGALATVQDLGRTGALRWGVGSSGAMDPLALVAGNLLLGNEEDAAG
ncbi:MAG TPA: allophanate hydrolase, partial [Ramlibacter sp.]|nr:allophanate hydrolase [Ramlibacter sp.]